jgi:TPR repeat protein
VPVAQNTLGGFYEFGLGLTQDYVRTYMWYKVAAANSTGDAPKDWHQEIEIRSQVA